MNGDDNLNSPDGGGQPVRKQVAAIVLGTLILVLTTSWVGLSLSGVFEMLPSWVSYVIVGVDLVILFVVWQLLNRRAK